MNQMVANVLMREAANQCGWGNRFRKLPMAVTFDPDFVLDAPGAPLPIAFQQSLGIRGSLPAGRRCQLRAQLRMVINLTVEDNHEATIGRHHGLVSGRG